MSINFDTVLGICNHPRVCSHTCVKRKTFHTWCLDCSHWLSSQLGNFLVLCYNLFFGSKFFDSMIIDTYYNIFFKLINAFMKQYVAVYLLIKWWSRSDAIIIIWSQIVNVFCLSNFKDVLPTIFSSIHLSIVCLSPLQIAALPTFHLSVCLFFWLLIIQSLGYFFFYLLDQSTMPNMSFKGLRRVMPGETIT